MTEKKHRPTLTDEERQEKLRLRSIYKNLKKEWQQNNEKLTDIRLGELVAAAAERKDPYTQSFIWQITSLKSDTRIPEEFALGMAKAFDFDVEDISPRFKEKISRYATESKGVFTLPDQAGTFKTVTKDLITISQFNDVIGSMGRGLMLSDQPGRITGWNVTKEWLTKNVPSNTGDKNLRIVTGFGDSMKGMFNSGDPLLIDVGVTEIKWDGVYFFRIGEEGFIKRLQRIPGQGIRALSANPEYEAWTITPDMDFHVLGLVLKVWEGSTF